VLGSRPGHRVLGGVEGHGRMELPLGEPLFDGRPVVAGCRQARGQALGPAPHLLRSGHLLLRGPTSMTPLEGFRESTEVAEGERGNARAHRQLARSVGSCQLEGDQPGQRPTERRVLSHLVPETE